MPSYAHKKLIQQIALLDEAPAEQTQFAKWIKAANHLDFLSKNGCADEIIVYASGRHFFVHSMIIPNDRLAPPAEDLLNWHCSPYTSIASIVYGGGRDDVWIERGPQGTGSKTLDAGMDLVFARTFEGWRDDAESTYLEINQEYAHIAGIHWRPEHGSYCRFDSNGDLDHIVSVTKSARDKQDVSLVSFSWKALEEYLTVSRSSLVRMFDFTLLRYESFGGWPDDPEEIFRVSTDYFYRQKVVEGHAAYTRGVHVVRPRHSASIIFDRIKGGPRQNDQYVEFIAYDWRNKREAKISTDPAATTNYFAAKGNSLPYELSPAFFRAEVLSKYKTDRDKYTVQERDIRCRSAWALRGYDVNEAGQVHAYICDLRDLPYSEQLHWLSFNEPPKAPISERAYVNDFKGEFVNFASSSREILSLARRWHEKSVPWWKLRDSTLLEQMNTPLSASKDEWSEAFMDVAKLIVEGFDVGTLRAKLDALAAPFDPKDQSISLLEKLISASQKSPDPIWLEGLRTVQLIRTKVKGHVGGSEAKQIARAAMAEHETFAAHFEHVCRLVSAELEAIERAMK